MSILLLLLVVGAEPIDTVVVCPPALRTSIQPWVEHRQSQGYQLAFAENRQSAANIRRQIAAQHEISPLKSVLLVGDASSGAAGDNFTTPTFLIKAKVNLKWGSEDEIATDHPFADLDGDGAAEFAIGRLPADNADELKSLVAKILAYEKTPQTGAWRRQVRLTTGVGGFGLVADTVIETVTKQLLTDELPADYETSLIHASWRSPYFPNPYRFREKTIASINEGSLFWVYIGHGARHRLDYVRTPGGEKGFYFPILGNEDVAAMNCQGKWPVALFLACYTGAYDDPKDSLAENAMKSPGGPIASIAGSRVTMPYAMTVLARGMMHEHFANGRQTLGDIVMHAKRKLLAGGGDDEKSKLIDAIAQTVSPLPGELAAERLEHAMLFNLLGDPLLRLPVSQKIELSFEPTATAGEPLLVKGALSQPGNLTLELALRRDRVKGEAAPRSQFVLTKPELAQMDRIQEQANDKIIWTRTTLVDAGQFAMPIDVPAELGGPCTVRAICNGADTVAIGGENLFVRAKAN